MNKFVVTIARGFGSGGKTIGKMLAKELDINYYDNDLIRLASEVSGINISLFGKADESVKKSLFKRANKPYNGKIIPPYSSEFVSDENLFNYQAKIIRELAESESCIIIGRCADYVLRDCENTVRVFVHAPMKTCIKKVCEIYSVTEKEAKAQIERIDETRAEYYKYYTGNDWTDSHNYDLCLNTERISFEQSVKMIAQYLKIRELMP